MTDLARSWSTHYGVNPTGTPALIVDVLETHNEWMTRAQIFDAVNQIRPAPTATLNRALHRLRTAGILETCWRAHPTWGSEPQTTQRTRLYRIPTRFYE